MIQLINFHETGNRPTYAKYIMEEDTLADIFQTIVSISKFKIRLDSDLVIVCSVANYTISGNCITYTLLLILMALAYL